MEDIYKEIINMSYGYLKDKNVTQQVLRGYIDRVKVMYDAKDLDEAELFRRLESIHMVKIGRAEILDDAEEDHIDWFNPSTGEGFKRKINWHFWPHYSEYLTNRKFWPEKMVQSIDQLSNQILSRLEDPERPGPWYTRGLVMGSIQSGKTANYTALITKAADAGYKLVIVLAGLHNSLRTQTQLRLNEEFVGYDIDKVQKYTGDERKIGVRTLFDKHNPVHTLTSSNENGDFSRRIAAQVGVFPNKDGAPILLVIKKNVSILKNLVNWIESFPSQSDARDTPLLLIDDECDFASINTKEPEKDENDNIDRDWDPTETNKQIRKILEKFEKKVYVGYTATPYANVFIPSDDIHPIYGDDLFPKNFIINLPQPSNYLGPEKVFGLDCDPDHDAEATGSLPLVRTIGDQSRYIPDGHKKELIVDQLPDSLKHALKCFLLTCAARRLRSEGVPHNSMLVHVTRFTAVQNQISMLIEIELRGLVSRIMSKDDLADFREIWENDFIPTSRKMFELGFSDAKIHEWSQIEGILGIVARAVQVKTINGTVMDVLDYKEAEMNADHRKKMGDIVEWEDKGLSVIAVGGDKLSRGLTLEGLSITYYLRASRLYDTLMQMGRWFGYRGGYSDLCRIFTTDELISWYRHIAMATQELREEIVYMSNLKLTPNEFGLKVRTHPGQLAVTSAGKSRSAQRMSISYAGRISETILFDPRHSKTNLRALEGLIRGIGREPDVPPEKTHGFHWKRVPARNITTFLASYMTPDLFARFVDPKRIAAYIEKQNSNRELVEWDVVVISKSKEFLKNHGTSSVFVADYKIDCITRNPDDEITDSTIRIKRLVSPPDEALDLSDNEKTEAREYSKTWNISLGESIRHIRPRERGLLLVYLPTGKYKSRTYGGKGNEIVAWAISFPESQTAQPIEYLVNSIYQKQDTYN
jgi:hypothetical protein